MGKSIKSKIIIRTSIIIILSIIISAAVSYYYFSSILKQQAIKDDEIKLYQISQQMEYMVNDIIRFSNNIATDQVIQNLIQQSKFDNGYDQASNKKNVSERLQFYSSLRDFIHSAMIITEEGNVYNNLIPYDSDYIISELENQWYLDYSSNPNLSFSSPHIINIQGQKGEVISYKVEIKNIKEPSKIIGELILNIHKPHFERYIKENSRDYDEFLWENQNKITLFQKESKEKYIDSSVLLDESDQKKEKGIITIENEKGYATLSTLDNTHWLLIGFTSNKSLFQKVQFVFYFFLILVISSVSISILTITLIITNITEPITKLTEGMKEISKGNMDVNISISSGDEMETLCNGFNKMARDIQQYLDKIIEHEKNKKEMQFDILLSQINPHFLYNVLNTVVYIANDQKNYDIVKIVKSLIKILQEGLRIGENEIFITLGKELEITNHYLTIQKYRYPNKFEIIWDVDEELLYAQIPKTIIQPLIENSLFHGICPGDKKGIIKIKVFAEGGHLNIIIEDDGIGMDKEKIDEIMGEEGLNNSKDNIRNIGIVNIRDRIKYLYGQSYKIDLKSELEIGTKIVIEIPLEGSDNLAKNIT